jgi:hypothetical protein
LGAHFISRSPRVLNATSIYELSHPPPATRMQFFIRHLALWWAQNRPNQTLSMTQIRFEEVLRATALAVWGPEGSADWSAQVGFLASPAGRVYTDQLTAKLDAYKESLGV